MNLSIDCLFEFKFPSLFDFMLIQRSTRQRRWRPLAITKGRLRTPETIGRIAFYRFRQVAERAA